MGNFIYLPPKPVIFLNASTDHIQILTPQEQKLIPRNFAEKEFGPAFLEIRKAHANPKILTLNGPGGFTNLRVVTLTINLLQRLEKNTIQLYDISKIDLFGYAISQNTLPAHGAVYIGQKQTLRNYNFVENTYTLISKAQLPYEDKNFFFDKVYDQTYFSQNITDREVEFFYNAEELTMKYGTKTLKLDIDALPAKKVPLLTANYMVEPVIGPISKS